MSLTTAETEAATDVAAAYDPTLPAAELRRIVGGALLCGAIGEFFLRRAPGIGIGETLFLLCVAAAILSVAYRRTGSVPGSVRLPLFAALPFSILLAVRDDGMVTAWNLAFAVGALALAADAIAPESMLQLTTARLRDVFWRFGRTLRHILLGAVPLVGKDAASALRGYSRRWYAVRLIARAAALAIVLASAFAALLAAGDPVFRRLFAWTVEWSPRALLFHVLGVTCWAWPVAGFLRGAIRNPPVARPSKGSLPISLGAVDATVALASVNGIFALFVLVQLRVLFGGQAYVMATTGLTLAEYARGGFFVLVATSAIVLVLLLAVNALLDEDGIAPRPAVRRQAFLLITLTGLVLVSAIGRMVLYVRSFGLSLDRVYALSALLWIGTLLVLFATTVLRGRATRFALGVIVSGWITLLGVNAANPDQLVVADSVRRVERHQRVDWHYLSSNLSADAVPGVVQLLIASTSSGGCVTDAYYLPSAECRAAQTLLADYGRRSESLGAAWSLADSRARAVVLSSETALRQIAGQ